MLLVGAHYRGNLPEQAACRAQIEDDVSIRRDAPLLYQSRQIRRLAHLLLRKVQDRIEVDDYAAAPGDEGLESVDGRLQIVVLRSADNDNAASLRNVRLFDQ